MSSPYRISIREFRAHPEYNWNITKLSSQALSPKFIREYKDKLNWNIISEKQRMSEEFIDEFQDYINWNKLCTYWARSKFSEQFALEHKDKVNWRTISYYMNFSLEFLYEHIDLIDVSQLLMNYSVRDKIMNDVDFLTFLLRRDTIEDRDKRFLWSRINIDLNQNFDFLREFRQYLTTSTLIGRFNNIESMKRFVNEFHQDFDADAWKMVEYNLAKCDFDFIMKYTDKWSKRKESSPIKHWSYINSRDKFTREQEDIINTIWSQK